MLKEVLKLAVITSTLMAHSAISVEYSTLIFGIPAEQQRDSSAKITLVFPKEYAPHAELFKTLTLNALKISSKRTGLKFRDSFTIDFDPSVLDHNGLTTVIPTNRITINTEAPENDSSIAFSEDYLEDTLIHEMGHMLAIQQRSGAFVPLSYVFGTTSRPLGLWPRWFHEGFAVWTEEALGGRPQTGSIDRDLRLYAEYSRRNSQFHLNSDDFDGDYATASIYGGRIPYSFGYLIVKDVFDKIPSDKFVMTSSRSLGFSFRPVLRSMGYALDTELAKLQKGWAARPLKEGVDHWQVVSSAGRMRGPFQADEEISWIEMNIGSSGGDAKLVKLDPVKGVEKVLAPQTMGSIEAAYYVGAQDWILVTRLHPDELEDRIYNPVRNNRRRVGMWREGAQSFDCVFPVEGTTRDITFAHDKVLWVATESDGRESLTQGLWNRSCEILGQEKISEGRVAFERLSDPSTQGTLTAWTQTAGRNLSAESVRLSNGQEISSRWPLTQPQILSPKKLVALQHTKDSWGPVLIDVEKKRLSPLAVKTSIRRIILARNHLLGLREFWDHEEIVKLGAHEIDLQLEASPTQEVKTKTSHEELGPHQNVSDPKLPLEDYRPLQHVLPTFWNPIMGADGTGYFVAGSTFFSDIRNIYQGTVDAGYSSLTGKAFTSGLFVRNSSDPFPFFSPRLTLAYLPRYLGPYSQPAQDLWLAGLNFRYPAQLGRRYFLTLDIGGAYEYQQRIQLQDSNGNTIQDYPTGSFFIPSVAFSFHDHDGRDPLRVPNSLVDAKSGYFLRGSAKKIAGGEYTLSVSAEHGWYKKSGARWQVQWGQTADNNFPYSYFIFGGASLVNTQDMGDFLTRGYPFQFGTALSVVRLAHESDVRLFDRGLTVGWNRFKINNIDLRFIAETVTFSTLSKWKLGNRYFNTLGGELRGYGKVLTYIDYQAALGYYAGLSFPRSSEVALSLRASLVL